MPESSQEAAQFSDALDRLSIAMEQLQTRYDDSQRANRRVRMIVAAVLILLGAAAYHTFSPVMDLISQIPKPQPVVSRDIEGMHAQRQKVLAELSPEELEQVEHFEQQLTWVSDYLATYPGFNPGAAMALFLSEMSDAVKVMPAMSAEVRDMTAEMRAMNEKMSAVPLMANDVHGMHMMMGVMARSVDSTLGETGRMFPWLQ